MCLCTRLIFFSYFKWFYHFIAEVGWKRLALVRIESSTKMSRLLDNRSLAACVSQPSSRCIKQISYFIDVTYIEKDVSETMDELYDTIEKASKLLTSTINENVHTDDYKLKQELKLAERDPGRLEEAMDRERGIICMTDSQFRSNWSIWHN